MGCLEFVSTRLVPPKLRSFVVGLLTPVLASEPLVMVEGGAVAILRGNYFFDSSCWVLIKRRMELERLQGIKKN